MPATVALSTELAALTTRVVSLENSRLVDETAIKTLQSQLLIDEAKIAALTPPPVVTPPPPAADPQIQWRTGMESGDLSGWSEQVNTGTAVSTAVLLATE